MNPLEQLKSVLCDQSGKCSITGSDEDRATVDCALKALAEQPAQQQCPPTTKAEMELLNSALPMPEAPEEAFLAGIRLAKKLAAQHQEPTKAMIDAAERIDWSDSDVRGNIVNMWQAMSAAAPQPAQQQEHVEWVEAEPSVRGMRLRDILNPRFPAAIGTVIWHTEKPITNNPVFEVRQL